MKKEQVVNDWKLVVEESVEKTNSNESTIHKAFILIHIPSDAIIFKRTGKEYIKESKTEYTRGIMTAHLAEDGEQLICSSSEAYGVSVYELKKLLERFKGEQIVNDWKLITKESTDRSSPYASTTYYTFTLIYIPNNEVVLTLKGSIYGDAAGTELEEGITGAYLSEDGKYLICAAEYVYNAYTYTLADLLK